MKRNFDHLDEALEKATIDIENQRLREKYELQLSQSKLPKKTANRKIIYLATALALLLLIVFGFYQSLNDEGSEKNNVESIIASLDYHMDPTATSRGLKVSDKDQLKQVEKLLDENKVKEALIIFEKLDINSLTSFQKLNMTQTYMKLNRNDEAKILIDQLQIEQSFLNQETQWLKVLVMIQLGKIQEVKPLMQEIIDKKQYKWTEVKSILDSFK